MAFEIQADDFSRGTKVEDEQIFPTFGQGDGDGGSEVPAGSHDLGVARHGINGKYSPQVRCQNSTLMIDSDAVEGAEHPRGIICDDLLCACKWINSDQSSRVGNHDLIL